MARRTKGTLDVTGLSINDILQMDYNKIKNMNETDVKRISARLVSASNKRIRRLEKSTKGNLSPQLQKIHERGSMFSIKGKNRNQTLQEFRQMKDFLESKTGSVRGFNQVYKNYVQRFGGVERTEYQDKRFWKVYHKMENEQKGVFNAIRDKMGSTQIQQMLHDELIGNKKLGVKRLTDKFTESLNDIYEELENESKSYTGASSVFDTNEENASINEFLEIAEDWGF